MNKLPENDIVLDVLDEKYRENNDSDEDGTYLTNQSLINDENNKNNDSENTKKGIFTIKKIVCLLIVVRFLALKINFTY